MSNVIGRRLAWLRMRRSGPLKRIDALMLGAASGLSTTAMLVLGIALSSLVGSVEVSDTAILGAGAAAPLALACTTWWFERRGGMLHVRAVVALWWLAGGGLIGLTLLPARIGWAFPLLAGACMVAIGVGAAVGYLTQANVLAQTRDPSHAFAQAQRWTLVIGVTSTLAAGWVAQSSGARWMFAAMAIALAALGACHLCWGGLPSESHSPGRGTVRATARQSADIERDLGGVARTYAVWQIMYLLPALLGADPFVVAVLASVPRLIASVGMGAWGRLAERRPQHAASWGAACAVVGFIILAISGASSIWVIVGIGATIAEAGFNAVGTHLKGALSRRGRDPVRQQLVATLYRFATVAVAGGLLSAGWEGLRWALRQPVTAVSAVIVAIVAGLTLLSVFKHVPKAALRMAKHVLKADDASGEIVLAVLPARPEAAKRWFCVKAGDGWKVYGLASGEELQVSGVPRADGARAPETRIASMRLPAWVRPRHAPLRHFDVPLARLPGLPIGGVTIGDGSSTAVAKLVRTHDSRIGVRADGRLFRRLPSSLLEELLEPSGALQQYCRNEVDPDGVAAWYVLASDAFRGQVWVRARKAESTVGGDVFVEHEVAPM